MLKVSLFKFDLALILTIIYTLIGILEQVRRKTEERIVKIKTDTEELDKNRRTLEDKNKKERANKIQNEVIQSHKKNVEIDWNW